ncbi:hypothetical protein DMB66_40880 [Actinoplanes sp. ATCC 53533]|nr:hypothetical protein DMB66_40880 [Actinoplanes sp. ATCC 53533]
MSLVAASACSGGAPQRDAQPERVAEGREVWYFDSLEKMAATAELVVVAEVAKVEPGRWIGSKDGGDRDQARNVTLKVENVLRSTGGAVTSTVQLDEWGWDAKGHGYQFAGVTWTNQGDRGIYFLVPVADAPGQWRLVNSQGRVLIRTASAKTGSVAALDSSAETHDALSVKIESLTVEGLIRLTKEADQAVQEGRLQPLDKPKLIGG